MSRLFKRHKHTNSPHKTSNSNDDNFLQRLPKSARTLAIATILLATTGLTSAGVGQVADQISDGLKFDDTNQIQVHNRADQAGLRTDGGSWFDSTDADNTDDGEGESNISTDPRTLGSENASERNQAAVQPDVDTIINEDGSVEHSYSYDDGQAKVNVNVKTGGSSGADVDVDSRTDIKIDGETSISVQFDGDDYQDEGRNSRYNR